MFRRLSKRDLLSGRRAIRLDGAVLEIPPDRAWAYADGTYWEKDVLPYLTRAIAGIDDPVFYDVGANCGHYTLALAPRVKTVIAFEPIRRTFDVLRRNVERNELRNVELHRVALGEEAGEATFYLYGSSGLSSAIKGPIPAEGEEQVVVSRLDDLFAAGRLLAPDLIKIDTEGSELPILRGARRLLKETLPTLILEFHPEQADLAGYGFDELRRELVDHSYAVFDTSSYPMPLAPREAFTGNILALPPGRSI